MLYKFICVLSLIKIAYHIFRWDKKTKKYIRVQDDKKKIKTESGVYISATYKTNRWPPTEISATCLILFLFYDVQLSNCFNQVWEVEGEEQGVRAGRWLGRWSWARRRWRRRTEGKRRRPACQPSRSQEGPECGAQAQEGTALWDQAARANT